MTVELQSYVQPPADRIPTPTRITNVVATLKGTTRRRPTASTSSARTTTRAAPTCSTATGDAPGANDDASGTSAVLELARVMAPHPTEATIVFVAFAGEEQGLYGSTHFAEVAEQQGWNIQGVLNMDIIGSPLGGNGVRDPRTIRLFSEGVPTGETPAQTARRQTIGGENDGVSRQLARYIKETGENRATGMGVKLVWRRDRFLRSGDQVPFLSAAGRPCASPSRTRTSTTSTRTCASRTASSSATCASSSTSATSRASRASSGSSLAALARAPRAPVNARMIDRAARPTTPSCAGTPNPEPDVAGYEVVWRDSTEPLWTHARHVGNVTDGDDRGPQQGRQPGRRARDRPRRQPQPGRVPAARGMSRSAWAPPRAAPGRRRATCGRSAPDAVREPLQVQRPAARAEATPSRTPSQPSPWRSRLRCSSSTRVRSGVSAMKRTSTSLVFPGRSRPASAG